MRKKPPGKLLSKTAHQVDREYRIIHALDNTDVPVPKTYCLCEDESVVGTPFYIMEFLDGRMVTDPAFPDFSPEERRAMWRDAVRVLAAFHSVNPKSVGLGNFGRPTGFYDRQIKTFKTISAAQAKAKDVETGKPVGPIPHFDEMVTFFSDKSQQPKDRTTLIHGDYKIDNLVFHKTEPKVIGVLDWEMATIGHPLSDLVNLTGPWTWTRKVTGDGLGIRNPKFERGATAGLPTLEEAVSWYIEDSGYNAAPELQWGTAFGGFRGAIIMQGIAARYALRQASGTTAKDYAAQTGPYSDFAWSLVDQLQQKKRGTMRELSKL